MLPFFLSTKMSLSAQLPAWFLDVFCFFRFLASSRDRFLLLPFLSFAQNGKVWSMFWTFMVPLGIWAKVNEVLIFFSKYPLQYTDCLQPYKLIIKADRMLHAVWIVFQCGWLCGWLMAWDKKIVKCGKVIITYVL